MPADPLSAFSCPNLHSAPLLPPLSLFLNLFRFPPEWDFGGLPAWMLTVQPAPKIRSSDPNFLSLVRAAPRVPVRFVRRTTSRRLLQCTQLSCSCTFHPPFTPLCWCVGQEASTIHTPLLVCGTAGIQHSHPGCFHSATLPFRRPSHLVLSNYLPPSVPPRLPPSPPPPLSCSLPPRPSPLCLPLPPFPCRLPRWTSGGGCCSPGSPLTSTATGDPSSWCRWDGLEVPQSTINLVQVGRR